MKQPNNFHFVFSATKQMVRVTLDRFFFFFARVTMFNVVKNMPRGVESNWVTLPKKRALGSIRAAIETLNNIVT